jgi:hypothetical protein
LKSINGGGGSNPEYKYDADGRRVQKKVGSVTTDYFYDVAGNLLTEVQGGAWTKAYAYLGGQMLTQYSNGTTYFAHKDHLGSTRLLTKVDQTVQECSDYLPFGEGLACGGTATTSVKFTGVPEGTV